MSCKKPNKYFSFLSDIKLGLLDTWKFVWDKKILGLFRNMRWFFNDKFILLNIKMMIILLFFISFFYILVNFFFVKYNTFHIFEILSGSFMLLSWFFFFLFILLLNSRINEFFNKMIEQKYSLLYMIGFALIVYLIFFIPGMNYIFLFSLFFGFFLITGMGLITIPYLILEFLKATHRTKSPSKCTYYFRRNFDIFLNFLSIIIFLIVFFILIPANDLYFYVNFNIIINSSLELAKLIVIFLFWLSIVLCFVLLIQPFDMKKYYRLWSVPSFIPFVLIGGSLSGLIYYTSIESLTNEIGDFYNSIFIPSISPSSYLYLSIYIIFSVLFLFTGFLAYIRSRYEKEEIINEVSLGLNPCLLRRNNSVKTLETSSFKAGRTSINQKNLSSKTFVLWILNIVFMELSGLVDFLMGGTESIGLMAQPLVLLYGYPIVIFFIFIVVFNEFGKIICPNPRCNRVQPLTKNLLSVKKKEKCDYCGRKILLGKEKIDVKTKIKIYVGETNELSYYILIIFGLVIFFLNTMILLIHQRFPIENIGIYAISIFFILLGSMQKENNSLDNKGKIILTILISLIIILFVFNLFLKTYSWIWTAFSAIGTLSLASIVVYKEFLSQPKLKMIFENSEPYCRSSLTPYESNENEENSQGYTMGYWIRVRIQNNGKNVAKNCEGRLTKIFNADGSLFQPFDPVVLHWVGRQDFERININSLDYEFLDIIYTLQNYDEAIINCKESHSGPLPLRGLDTRLPPAIYIIEISISSENAKPVSKNFLLEWDGTWDNIKMREM